MKKLIAGLGGVVLAGLFFVSTAGPAIASTLTDLQAQVANILTEVQQLPSDTLAELQLKVSLLTSALQLQTQVNALIQQGGGSTQTPLTITSPIGGEEWQLGSEHVILWTPYDPQHNINTALTQVNAYLEKQVNGQYVTVGKIIETGKASIHWSGDLDAFGNYPAPGSYYIRLQNDVTGEVSRSPNPFTIVAQNTIHASLTINGSHDLRSLTVPTAGQDATAVWTSNASSCNLQVVGFDSSQSPQFSNQPASGSVTVRLTPNTFGVNLWCNATAPIEGTAGDSVTVGPQTPASAGPATIAVTMPNSGSLDYNTRQLITWNMSGVSRVTAYLYKNDASFASIARDVPVSGSSGNLTWRPSDTFPVSNPPTELGSGAIFKIYLIGYKSDGSGTVETKGGAFAITSPSSTSPSVMASVTNPAASAGGSPAVIPGGALSIHWTTYNTATTSVDIWFRPVNDTAGYQGVAMAVPNNGSYAWTVPATLALGSYDISVGFFSPDHLNFYRSTDQPFSIVSGVVARTRALQVTNVIPLLGNGQVTLTWMQPPGDTLVTGYGIYASTNPSVPIGWMNINAGITKSYFPYKSKDSRSFTATGLTNGTTYYFAIFSIGPDDSSQNSAPVIVSATPSATAQAGLTVVAASQPFNSLAPQGATNVPFTKFTLTAGSSDVAITGIKVQRTGTAPDAVISDVELLSDGMTSGSLLTAPPGFDGDHSMALSGTFWIRAGTSQTFTITCSMASNLSAASGQTVGLQLTNIGTSAQVAGTFPITGATHTVNSTLAIGTLSVDASSIALTPGIATVNTPNQILGAFGTTVANEPIMVQGMKFTVRTANGAVPQNVYLVDRAGRVVAGPVSFQNDQIVTNSTSNLGGVVPVQNPSFASLNFTDTVTIPVGNSTYYLKGTLPANYAGQLLVITTIPFSGWTGVTGATYQYGIAPARGAVNINQVTVGGSTNPTVSITADKTSGQAPLTVSFTATLNVQDSCGGGNRTWTFGGSETPIGMVGECTAQIGTVGPNIQTVTPYTVTQTHTYNNSGTYQATYALDNYTSAPITITVAAVKTATYTWQPVTTGGTNNDGNFWGPAYCDNQQTQSPFAGPAVCASPSGQNLTGQDCTQFATNNPSLPLVKTAYDIGHNFKCTPATTSVSKGQMASSLSAIQAMLEAIKAGF